MDQCSGLASAVIPIDIPDKPYVGMEFPTEAEAYKFYNMYALKTGFGVRKGPSSYSRSKKEENPRMIGKTFFCGRGRTIHAGNDESTHKQELKAGCGARMRIALTSFETWKVSIFVEEHKNHDLISPDKAMKHRSHMVVHRSEHVTDIMDRPRGEGLPPSTISRVLNVANEGTENVITPQQCQTHLRKRRKNNIGSECSSIIDHFAHKVAADPDFYFAWEVDENRTLRSVFWADSRARSSYMQFGDVVAFDVMYRTNKLCLPFAPFTGVNHHKQSILFGCALLADEEEETFVWLFSEWLKCMHGQTPVAIITYQDIAMGNAIKRVFPDTRHRFCPWHISKHVLEHMPKLQSLYGEDIVTYFNKWRNSNNIEQAENHWSELQMKFNIDEKENTWLPTMYRKRHHWIDAYLHDVFWAGMKSTQQSESMNAIFDSFVNSHTLLHEFISCYDKALEHQHGAELQEDFLTLNSKLSVENFHPIEVQASKLYTMTIFKLFQEEMRGRDRHFLIDETRSGCRTVYNIGSYHDEGVHNVEYKEGETMSVKCSCTLFETVGILCRHILIILCHGRRRSIPEQYFLHRWRIDARRRCIQDLLQERGTVDRTKESILQGWATRATFNEVWKAALTSRTIMKKFHAVIYTFGTENGLFPIQRCNESQVSSNSMTHLSLEEHITISDPSGPVLTKERPRKATRLRSGLEESMEQKVKKQRTCQRCFQKGHYRSSCKNSPKKSLPRIQDSEDDKDDEDDMGVD